MTAAQHLPLDQITLAILAGGKGSRMGMAKGSLQIGGEPLAAFLLRQLDWPGPTLLVTAPGREHPPGCECFDSEAIDPLAQGPMRGVLTALENSRTSLLAVLTIDMPGVRRAQIRWLAEQLDQSHGLLGVMNRRNTESGAQVEPFPSIFRAAALELIRRRLDEERRSMQGLIDGQAFGAIDAPPHWDDCVWENLNSPSDFQAFVARVQR